MDTPLYTRLSPDWNLSYGHLENTLDTELAETEDSKEEDDHGPQFSWVEYCCFFAIGMSMMWTWYVALPFQHATLLTSWLGR